MANPTMTLIGSSTVGSTPTGVVTFSSIPQTGYTDLVIKCSTRSNNASNNPDLAYIYLNGSTATNYSLRRLYGDGSAAYSDSLSASPYFTTIGFSPANSATANTFSNNEIYIPNYASSNNKSVSIDTVSENNSSTTNYTTVSMQAGLRAVTDSITSVSIGCYFGSFVQYSTFYLYGISNS